MTNKVKNLVVDTGAFLRNSPLQNYGDNIYTCPEVLAEVKSKWAKDQLQILPYDIKIKEPEEEDLEFVVRFARKTGDIFTLSKTDLKVMALAVCMEREKNGNVDHLKKLPTSIQIVSNQPSKQNHKKTQGDDYGFNFKNKMQKNNQIQHSEKSNDNLEDENEEENENKDNNENEEKMDKKNNENKIESDAECDQLSDDEENEYDSCEEDADFNDYYTDLVNSEVNQPIEEAQESDDDGDWITPSNIDQVKKQFDGLKLSEKSTKVEIDTACITGDFSMQNVLMQIGIKILSVDRGLIIKQTRQFVLRCIACFAISNNKSLIFCPSCGNLKTLKKVSVSVDENGQKRIHLNPKRAITTRDVKLRIPRPRKGKYALNPILVSDQHVPKFRQAKFAIQERKSINDTILSDVGYLVRDNPFSLNDVYSRSSNYKTGSRAAAINKMVFNEGRKYSKKKSKRRN